jgi:hypothetical protein
LIENEEGESHYVWIKSINALLASKTNHKTKFICSQCAVDSFSSQESLDYHLKNKYAIQADGVPRSYIN